MGGALPVVLTRDSTAGALVAYSRQHLVLVATISFLLVIDAVRALAMPRVLGLFVDAATTGSASAPLLRLGSVYALLALATPLFGIAISLTGHRFASSFGHRLRLRVLAHCVDIEPDLIQRTPSAQLVEETHTEVERVATTVHRLVSIALPQGLLLIGIVIAVTQLDPRFALVFLVAAVGGWGARRLVGRAVDLVGQERAQRTQLLGYLQDRARGVLDLRGVGATEATMAGFDQQLARQRNLRLRTARAAAWWPLSAQGLGAVTFLATLSIGIVLHQRGSATLGEVFAALNYMFMLRSQLASLTSQSRDIDQLLAGARALDRLMAQPVPDGRGDPLPPGPLGLSLDAVRVRFGAGPNALDGVDLDLPAGRRLGVIGRTGAGKSTLLRVLAGTLTPQHGTVRVGGQDLRATARADLRRRVLMLPQRVQILTGTVRDNVTLFDPTYSDAQVHQALQDVGLGEWLQRQDCGLDTMLAPASTGLSPGEGQLLTVARALLREPAVVLLDETSAHLDQVTGERLRRALGHFLTGRTAVIVTHNAADLVHADTVVALDAGRIRQ